MSAFEWSDEDGLLIRWFYNNIEKLHQEPYKIDEVELSKQLKIWWKYYQPSNKFMIKNPHKYYTTLKADIACGPTGWNCSNGTLRNRLKILKHIDTLNNYQAITPQDEEELKDKKMKKVKL